MPNKNIKNHKLDKSVFKNRVGWLIVFISFGCACLFVRLYQLQINEYLHFNAMSQHNQFSIVPLDAKRGLIYDRYGTLLAENILVRSLDIIPNQTKNLAETIKKIEQLISLSQANKDGFFKQLKLQNKSKKITIKLKLTQEDAAKIYLDKYLLPGTYVTSRLIRSYPKADETVAILGYVGRITENELREYNQNEYINGDYIGKTGIENFYNNELKGTPGYQQIETNANGYAIRDLLKISPIKGQDITLSIDEHLQSVAHAALQNYKGAVVAIEPTTGKVLALTSQPSFDPNLLIQGISNRQYKTLLNTKSKPMFNRATKGQFPIASIIKPFVGLKALANKIITKDTTINDKGWFKFPNYRHVYHDWIWKYTKDGHGLVNLHKAIVVSCDTFFYELADKIGINNIHDVLVEFGFGNPTGIDLDEEMPGLVASPAWKQSTGHKWVPGDTINSIIGQGAMLTTPLQLAFSTSIIANRGKVYQPSLIQSITKLSGKKFTIPPKSLKNIEYKQTYWNEIISAMEGVIFSTNPIGTGYKFGHPSYSIAAKTGTAQLYEIKNYHDKVPNQLQDHSIFTGFAPVKNPKIVLVVVLENSNDVVLVAKKIMDEFMLNPHNKTKHKLLTSDTK